MPFLCCIKRAGAVVGAALGGLAGAALGASGLTAPEPDLGDSDSEEGQG